MYIDHLLTIFQPTTYRPPTDHLPTTYRLLTNHLLATYWPPTCPLTNHSFRVQLVHNKLPWLILYTWWFQLNEEHNDELQEIREGYEIKLKEMEKVLSIWFTYSNIFSQSEDDCNKLQKKSVAWLTEPWKILALPAWSQWLYRDNINTKSI